MENIKFRSVSDKEELSLGANFSLKDVTYESISQLGFSAKRKLWVFLAKKYGFSEIQDQISSELNYGTVETQWFADGIILAVAFVHKEEEKLIRGLENPSKQVRKIAANLCAKGVKTEENIQLLLNKISTGICVSTRKRLIKNILRFKRKDIAERLFNELKKIRKVDDHTGSLLTLCSKEVIQENIKSFSSAITNWESIARFHPEIYIKFLDDVFTTTPIRNREKVWKRFYTSIVTYLKYTADVSAFVALIDKIQSKTDPLHPKIKELLGLLVGKDSNKTFELISALGNQTTLAKEGIPAVLLKQNKIRKIEYSKLVELGKIVFADRNQGNLIPILRKLAPNSRSKFLLDCCEGIDLSDMIWDHELFSLVDAKTKEILATTMLQIPAINTNQNRKFEILSYLPLTDEVKNQFIVGTRANKAHERGQALEYLIRAYGYSNESLDTIIGYIMKYKNDQDPVRICAYHALSDYDTSKWEIKYLAPLDGIINEGIAARDTSFNSFEHLMELFRKIINKQIALGVPNVELFNGAMNLLLKALYRAYELTDDNHAPYYPAHIKSLMQNYAKDQEKIDRVISLYLSKFRLKTDKLCFINYLGDYWFNNEECQSLVKNSLKSHTLACDLYIQPPKTRDARFRELYNADSSFFANKKLQKHIFFRRQEWVPYYLQHKKFSGMYSRSYDKIVPFPFHFGYQRWNIEDLKRYSKEVMMELINNEHQPSKIQTLARFPITDIQLLIDNWISDEAVAGEQSFRAIRLLDSQIEQVSALAIAEINTNRARIAMYMFPLIAREMKHEFIRATIQRLLTSAEMKLTSHKECLRLIGQFDLGADLLINDWKTKELPRDAKIAASHAARKLLHHPEAWELLNLLVVDAIPHVASSALKLDPSTVPPQYHSDYVQILLKGTDHGSVQVRRISIEKLVNWAEGHEETIAKIAIRYILISPEYNNNWWYAMKTLVTTTSDNSSASLWINLVKGLISYVPNPDDINIVPTVDADSEVPPPVVPGGRRNISNWGDVEESDGAEGDWEGDDSDQFIEGSEENGNEEVGEVGEIDNVVMNSRYAREIRDFAPLHPQTVVISAPTVKSTARDLPHIQRLLRFINLLITIPAPIKALQSRYYEEVAELLRTQELFVIDGCRIEVGKIADWFDVSKIVEVLTKVAIWSEKQPFAIPLVKQLIYQISNWNRKVAVDVITSLQKHENELVRYLAYFLLENVCTQQKEDNSLGTKSDNGCRFVFPITGEVYYFDRDALVPPPSTVQNSWDDTTMKLLKLFRTDPCVGIRSLACHNFTAFEK